MCGIVGIFDLRTENPIAPDRIDPAMAVLRARGPDGEGKWSGPGCLLGHRRLSILDPAGGQQPWVDPLQGAGALTYNGELYNFRELREHYASRGYHFRSQCDTEVVFAAWSLDGAAALERCNGIFAFAVTDGAGRLWLVRDQLGVKPLYYAVIEGTLLFASSMAGLLTFAEIPRRLDRVAAAHYLATARTNLDDRTLVEGVRLLPPGHVLAVERGQDPAAIRSVPYWRLPALSAADKADLDATEAQARCREVMAASVRRQLQSDVPVGAFLSGGLDSSILLALSKDVQGDALGSYGVEFVDAPDSQREGSYMQTAARAIGTRLRGVQLRQTDFRPTWDRLLATHGQPLSTPNEVAISHLAAALRQDYTVALGGEGADEVFAGYTLPYGSAWDYERSLASTYSSVLRARIKDFYGQSSFPHMAAHHLALNVWMRPAQVCGMLGASLESIWAPVYTFYEGLLDDVAACTPLDRYLHLHRRVNLEGLLLRLDANTMAASVEGRVPFTDREVVEWANTLPDAFRLRRADRTQMVPWRDNVAADWIQRGWLEGKWVLREAFRPRLPAVIVDRPKMSFPVPFENELAASSAEDREWIAATGSLDGLVDRAAVLAFWDETEVPGRYFRRWPVINLLRWADKWKIES